MARAAKIAVVVATLALFTTAASSRVKQSSNGSSNGKRGDRGTKGNATARQSAGDSKWQKIMLPTSGGAMCLDGSPGGFFLRRNEASRDWIVFHQGGGWCSSPDNCASRALSNLGSSTGWPDTYEDMYEGSEFFATPPFDSFNVAFAMYCDGGSWSGNIDVPYNNTASKYNGTVLHYRGRPLLDALLEELFSLGMSKAQTLVYSGCSAGGLTTYAHADYVADRLRKVAPDAAVLALADAMFSLEHDAISGAPQFQKRMQWGYQTWNNSQSLNQGCVSFYGEDNGWKCMFGGNTAQFVKTPTFIVNSKYDVWQEVAILGLNCSIGQCDAAVESFWIDYGHTMVSTLNKVPARHGAFLTNCPTHCQTGSGGDWLKRSVNGMPLGEAVVSWFNKTLPAVQKNLTIAAPRWVSTCDEKPCGADVC